VLALARVLQSANFAIPAARSFAGLPIILHAICWSHTHSAEVSVNFDKAFGVRLQQFVVNSEIEIRLTTNEF